MSEFTFDLPPLDCLAVTDSAHNLAISKVQAVIIFSNATGISVDQSKALIEQNWELIYASTNCSTYVRPLALGRMIRAYYLAEKEK